MKSSSVSKFDKWLKKNTGHGYKFWTTPSKTNLTTKQTEKTVEKKLRLTNLIDCRWCGAKAGEPCKIQPPTDYKGHPSDYFLGNDKTYFKQEVIHLCRAI